MATPAHNLSRLMPGAAADWLRPRWHWFREAKQLRKLGGSLDRSSELGDLVARRPFGPDKMLMPIVIRSYRELRRYVQFGSDRDDIVHSWLHGASNCRVLYDIGSANGLEGFLMNHLHGSKTVFVEPFTPSIESILKTIHIKATEGCGADRFEVFHAGCDEQESYDRLYMHGVPKAGETLNSFAHPDDYCRGGRNVEQVFVSQWLKGVSLDALHESYGIDLPTHVKIDVDGFEGRVMRGAAKLLARQVVDSWAIEVTGEEHIEAIPRLMTQHGYTEIERYEHYPGTEPRTFDLIFERNAQV